MAKSIRSKRQRKLRSIKRKRYAAKELIRLKKMLGVPVTEEELVIPTERVMEFGFKKWGKKEKREPVNNPKMLDFKFTEKGTLMLFEPSDDEFEEVREKSEGEDKSKEGGTEINDEIQREHTTKEGEMEMDHSEKKVYDPVTKKDQSGNYPAWFTQKDIKRQAKKNRLRKKIKEKQAKLRADNEKKNKKFNKFIRRKSKKPKSKDTNEENSKEVTEEKSKETMEGKSTEITEEKSKEPSTEKCNIVEQSNNDQKQCVKMEN